jgi:hypothetical protein
MYATETVPPVQVRDIKKYHEVVYQAKALLRVQNSSHDPRWLGGGHFRMCRSASLTLEPQA